MPKGFGGMPPGGMNMNSLMKQAQKMQRQMEEMQEEIKTRSVEASSGGGAVKVVVNGERAITALTIEPDVLDDVEMLQDLVTTAVNEAHRQVEEMISGSMSKVTGGMNMPGLF